MDRRTQEAIEQATIAEMVRATEKEILDEAMGLDSSDDNYEMLERASRVEGWDGLPLEDDEIAERNISGDQLGDRPLQTMREEELATEVERLRDIVNNNEAVVAENNRFQGEENRNAWRAQQHDALMSRGMLDPRARDEVIDSFEGQMQQTFSERNRADTNWRGLVNQSFQDAHERYGNSFVEAFDAMQRLDASDPLAHQFAQRVVNAQDPGEAVMEFGHSDVIRTLGAGRPRGVPFHPNARSRDTSMTMGDLAEADGGFGNQNVESEVFDSIWNNDEWTR